MAGARRRPFSCIPGRGGLTATEQRYKSLANHSLQCFAIFKPQSGFDFLFGTLTKWLRSLTKFGAGFRNTYEVLATVAP